MGLNITLELLLSCLFFLRTVHHGTEHHAKADISPVSCAWACWFETCLMKQGLRAFYVSILPSLHTNFFLHATSLQWCRSLSVRGTLVQSQLHRLPQCAIHCCHGNWAACWGAPSHTKYVDELQRKASIRKAFVRFYTCPLRVRPLR